jgi:iron complex outermembrane receptor protein
LLKTVSLRNALLGGAAVAMLAAPAFAREADDATLVGEIIVTATKRAENVRDVTGSVSAVSGAQLEALGAESFADYIQRVPGVTFNEFQPGTSHVVIRGVATNSGNVQGQGTTGYYINDVPLTEPGWTIVIPDIDTFDVERVEVLRGPQGSLFGSASMGGAVNYVAAKADSTGFEAALESTFSQTRNASLGYGVKAMVNVPVVSDKLAIRGVYGYRLAPGFLDNVGAGVNGSTDIAVEGGRLSVVWTPTADTEVSWLTLYQQTDADDAPYRNPAVGDLARSTSLLEPNSTSVRVDSLRVDHDFGFARFTAIAAYQKKEQQFLFDFTPYRAAYNFDLGLNLTSPLYVQSGGESEGKSLELRLASDGEGPFQWLIGGMYFESDKFLFEQLGAAGAAAQFDASPLFGPGSGDVISPDGKIFNAFFTDLTAKETAVFGEASWSFTPELKLTVGGRLYWTEVSSTSASAGFSTYPGGLIVNPADKDEQDGFSPKVSLTWTPNDSLMVYGLYSEGFRFGTPNTQGLSAYPVPSGSRSDSLKNYEVGVRADLLDKRLLIDATAFFIDWQDIQLRLLTLDNFNYAANGGSAKITGLEVTGSWRVTDSFDLTSSVTYMEGRLAEDLFILWYGTAPDGSRLPGSSDWSIANTAVYRFGGDWSPTVVASHRFVSEGISDMNSAVPGIVPNEQGDYNIFDARFSVDINNTKITVFADNIADERGVTRTLPEANGLSQGLIKPRTLGVTFNWDF